MQRFVRSVVPALALTFVFVLTVPALATEEPTEGDTTATTVAPVQISEGESPAVEAPPPDESAVEQPWTARYIYPTIVIVTLLLLVGVVIAYNRGIRSRYRVVSE